MEAKEINGTEYSWGSIKITIAGQEFEAFTAIDYGDKLTPAKTYGAGSAYRPRGRTRGKYECDNSKLTGFKDELQALRSALAAQSATGTSYGSVVFDVVIQFIEPAQAGDPTSVDKSNTVVLEKCKWIVDSSAHSESADGLTDSIELDTMGIRRNGLTLYEEAQA